ncbi:hypothetical protein GALMADRAFT_250783 [Galerina marginata CBS 339.88]|uniref:Uncharacterized protein n=1 Tax=Galerina marginata (strain CBS 339.88) TaxID=685588 RepID=A0A067T2A3_GALM3|nr:hypothetical protein GALMADRAFT_250783 [Galerina marginata CBS 339.88]
MSSAFAPGENTILKLKTLGLVFAATAYGAVVSLYASSFAALIGRKPLYSKRKQRYLLVYITFMLLMSTVTFVQNIYTIVIELFQDVDHHPSIYPVLAQNIPWFLTFTIWGADGFMVWRCLVLYNNIPKTGRFLLIGFLLVPSVLSLVSGVFLFTPMTRTRVVQTGTLLILISTSTAANVVFAGLIVFRLLSHQKSIRELLGRTNQGSIYTRIIVMCIESCASIVLFGVVYITVAAKTHGGFVVLPILPHICVISPLLIVYRVAKGREATVTLETSELANDLRNIGLGEDLRFNTLPSPPINPAGV